MKKRSFLAIFMVFVLCLSMMVGCQNDKDKKNKATEDTTEPKEALTLDVAMNNTMDALGTTDCSVPVLEDMSEKKVITVSMDGLFTNVLKLDVDNTALYDELSLNVEGQTVTGQIYCNGNDLALTSPELLGDVAVGINFSTFLQDLEASGLLELLMAELGDDLAQLEGAMSEYTESMDTVNATGEEMLALLEEVAQGVEFSESEGTATVYGAEVDAVIFTYTMDKDDFKKFLDLVLELYAEIYENELNAMVADGTMSAEEMEGTNPFTEAQEELDAVWGDVEMAGTLNFYANPDNDCVMQVEGIFTGTVENETLDATMTLTLGEDPATSDKYVLAMNMGVDGTQMMAMELALNSTTEGSVDTSVLTFTAEVEGEKMDILSCTVTYDNDTTAYELTLEADGDKISAKGTMDNTADKFIVTLDSLEAGVETLPLGLTLSVENDPNCEIPAVPEYANVLTDLGLAEMLGAQYATDTEEAESGYEENLEDYEY